MNWTITPNIASELISHEGIVREAYKDSVGVWTWSIGITTASGHKVYPRYVDNAQTLERCFEVFEWVIRTNYLPDVQSAFQGHSLTESQLAAALSFHYNTGGIGRATWVKRWKEGKVSEAENTIMNWKSPPEIIPRRRAEQALFFHGKWSNTGHGTEYPVNKPSYSPDFSKAKKVKISEILEDLFG